MLVYRLFSDLTVGIFGQYGQISAFESPSPSFNLKVPVRQWVFVSGSVIGVNVMALICDLCDISCDLSHLVLVAHADILRQ